MRFKNLEGNPKEKAQRRQYLLVVGLSCYKWYQSQTPSGVPARTLAQRGVDCEFPHRLEIGTSASEDGGSQMGVDCVITHRLERGTSVSENVGL